MLSIENIETVLPGVVVAVNGTTIDCKICLRKVSTNGVIDVTNSTIPDIPLMKLGGANAEFTFPTRIGDQVLLVAFSRDSEKWKLNFGDDNIPDSATGLTLNDFIAVPFVASGLHVGAAKIRVTEDGDIILTPKSGRISKFDGDMLVRGKISATGDIVTGVTESGEQIIDATAIHLQTHIHPTGVGPSSQPTPGT